MGINTEAIWDFIDGFLNRNKVEKKVIIGIVDFYNVQKKAYTKENTYKIDFKLRHWYRFGDDVQNTILSVHAELDYQKGNELLEQLKPMAVIQFEYEGDELLDQVNLIALEKYNFYNPRLMPLADEMKNDMTYTDQTNGTFTLGSVHAEFKNPEFNWNGSPIELSFETCEKADLSGKLYSFNAYFNDHNEWDSKIKEYAADRLLALKNDAWLDDDINEQPLSRDEFIQRLSIYSISVNAVDIIIISMHDDDLFGGHTVFVQATLRKGFTDAFI